MLELVKAFFALMGMFTVAFVIGAGIQAGINFAKKN
jgi:hypothetical protein